MEKTSSNSSWKLLQIHEVEEGDWEYLAVIEADEPCLTNCL